MESGEAVRIERLIRHKKGRPGEEIEVLLSDASSFFVALRSWQNRPFHEGDSLTASEVSSLRAESQRIAIRDHAMTLLARSDHSRFLLQRKLVLRGYESAIVDLVLGDLAGQGVLDDARFAASWTRDRIRRHPEGRSAVIAGLRQRGVGRETAEAVVGQVLTEEGFSPEDAVAKLAERFLRARGATRSTVSAKLLRRGFPSSLVHRVVGELTGDSTEIWD